jgi:hypothetical protein
MPVQTSNFQIVCVVTSTHVTKAYYDERNHAAGYVQKMQSGDGKK